MSAYGMRTGSAHRIDQRTEAGAEDDAVARREITELCGQHIDGGGHPSISVSKLKGSSSSMVMVFFTPVSSQR